MFYKSTAVEGRYFALLNTSVCEIDLVQHFVMKLTSFKAATKAFLTLRVILLLKISGHWVTIVKVM